MTGGTAISGLPAGEYYVCAATEFSALELYAPEFLEQLVAGSFKITLGDGEKKTQDMKIGSGGYQRYLGYLGTLGTRVRRVPGCARCAGCAGYAGYAGYGGCAGSAACA